MGGAGVALLVTLATGVVIVGVTYFLMVRANVKLAANSKVISFNSNIDPTTGTLKGFTNPQTGVPQISCPVGTTINIIGAFTSVIDPYGECTVTPSPGVSWMCNPNQTSPPPTGSGTASSGCQSDADCPFYQGQTSTNPYVCVIPAGSTQGPGVCQLQSLPPSSVCPTEFTLQTISGSNYCIPTDFCGIGIPNGMCSPSNTSSACATRDASANIASLCNGQQNCNPTITDFGTPACPGLIPPAGGCISSFDTLGNPVWNGARTGYCALPYLPGWSGGVPTGAGTNNPDPANASLGYQYHGVYTCV